LNLGFWILGVPEIKRHYISVFRYSLFFDEANGTTPGNYFMNDSSECSITFLLEKLSMRLTHFLIKYTGCYLQARFITVVQSPTRTASSPDAENSARAKNNTRPVSQDYSKAAGLIHQYISDDVRKTLVIVIYVILINIPQ
jgi:hypothetical protein